MQKCTALFSCQIGKTVKDSGKVTELLQSALELSADSPAHQLAEALSEQLERALTELGLDASELYHMSRTDQVKLIERACLNSSQGLLRIEEDP